MFVWLKFENAGLHYTKGTNCPNPVFRDNKCVENRKGDGDDFSNPIPSHVVANVLHVLCGQIPVPYFKETNLLSDDKLIDIAENHSMIKLDLEVGKETEKGIRPNYTESLRTAKYCWDSTKKQEKTYKTVHGSITTKNSEFGWDILERELLELYPVLIKILEEYVGKSIRHMRFDDFVYELSKNWDDVEKTENMVQKLIENGFKRKKPYLDFFSGKKNESNYTYNTNLPILQQSGISYITRVSGDIVCEIDDEEILERLKNNSGLAKILDGGIVYIHRIENNPGRINDYYRFKKVS